MSAEKKTLPTVPGWYARAGEPLTSDSTVWRLDDDGEWLFEQWAIPAEQMLRLAPLTRLVVETDTAQRPEVDVEEAWRAFGAGVASVHDDFVSVLRRVLEGEFDL